MGNNLNLKISEIATSIVDLIQEVSKTNKKIGETIVINPNTNLQNLFSKENAVYVIDTDIFTDENILMPANSTLLFEGGTLQSSIYENGKRTDKMAKNEYEEIILDEYSCYVTEGSVTESSKRVATINSYMQYVLLPILGIYQIAYRSYVEEGHDFAYFLDEQGNIIQTFDYPSSKDWKYINGFPFKAKYFFALRYATSDYSKIYSYRANSLTEHSWLPGLISINNNKVELDSLTRTMTCARVAVEPGDRFEITGEGDLKSKLFVWTNASGEIISEASELTAYHKIIEVPENAAYLVFNSLPFVGKIRKIINYVEFKGSIEFNKTIIKNPSFKNIKCINTDFTIDGLGEEVNLISLPMYNETLNPMQTKVMLLNCIDWVKNNGAKKLVFPLNKEYEVQFYEYLTSNKTWEIYDGVSLKQRNTVSSFYILNVEDFDIDFNGSKLQLEVNRIVPYTFMRVAGTCHISNGILSGDRDFKDYKDPEGASVTNEFNGGMSIYGDYCNIERMEICNFHGDCLYLGGAYFGHTSELISLRYFGLGDAGTARTQYVEDIKALIYNDNGELIDSTTWSAYCGKVALNNLHNTNKIVIPRIAYMYTYDPVTKTGKSSEVSEYNIPISAWYHLVLWAGDKYLGKFKYFMGDAVKIPSEATHYSIEVIKTDGTPYTEGRLTWWMSRGNYGTYNTVDNCYLHEAGRNALTLSGPRYATIKNTVIERYGGTNNELGIDIESDEGGHFITAYTTIENCTVGNPNSKDGVSGGINLGCSLYSIVKNCLITDRTYGIYGLNLGHIIEGCRSYGSIGLDSSPGNLFESSVIRNCIASTAYVSNGLVENCVLEGATYHTGNYEHKCRFVGCTININHYDKLQGGAACEYRNCTITVSKSALLKPDGSVWGSGIRPMSWISGGSDIINCIINVPYLGYSSHPRPYANFINNTINITDLSIAQSAPTLEINNKFVGNTINNLYTYGTNGDLTITIHGKWDAQITDNTFNYKNIGWWWGNRSRFLISVSHGYNVVNEIKKEVGTILFARNHYIFPETAYDSNKCGLVQFGSSYDIPYTAYVEDITTNCIFSKYAINKLGSNGLYISLYCKNLPNYEAICEEGLYNKIITL